MSTTKVPYYHLILIEEPQSEMEMSPESEMLSHPQIQEQQMFDHSGYQGYNIQLGSDEQCRKALPDRQNPDSPSSMSLSKKASRTKDRSSGKKRVMFSDQERANGAEQVKQDLFNQSEGKYANSYKNTSQGYGSDSEPQTLEKYPKKESYDHFHDESMSKLEAVLQRQRERLENLGGFSGKSSQISHKTNEQENNLEEAYQDLEDEINNIKRNLEASQNSDTSGYSPMKAQNDREQEEMSLSPSDLGQ